jgi:hypothetical protein
MKLTGLAIVATLALASHSASAMPAAPLGTHVQTNAPADVQNVRLVCNRFGRCWHRPNFVPRVYGYGGGWRARHGWHRHGWHGGPRRWHGHRRW